VKRAWKWTAVLAVVSVGLDLGLSHYAHPEFWWHRAPAFDFLYGFIGCVATVFFSKWLGHELLMRDENYYERDR